MSQNAVIERALLRVLLPRVLAAELAGLAFLLAAFLLSDSLALLAQTARHGCLVLGACIETLVVRAALRRVPDQYDFGLEKLERSCQLILGLILMIAGGWILSALPALAAEGTQQAPVQAAIAATCHAGWLLWAWPGLAPRGGTRPVALAVQLALTAAALSPDAGAAQFADLLASGAVAALALVQGARVLFDSLRDLLDFPADGRRLAQVLEILRANGLERRRLLRLRSRESKERLFVHLTVAAAPDEPLAALGQRLSQAKAALEATTHNVDLVFSVEADRG